MLQAFRRAFYVSALNLLSGAITFAQVSGGSIVGLVTDSSGAMIAAARVRSTNVETNVTTETTTNDVGYYEFPLLPAGKYRLTVEASGFQRATTGSIVLHAGTKPRIDFSMKVGELTESVQVLASAPLVNATTTEMGVVIDSQQVKNLPLNGRGFDQLLALEPGYNKASVTSSYGGAELNGMSGVGNNWLLDGISMAIGEKNGVGITASGGGGTVINMIGLDAIEELKTSSGAMSAEYGRATGGVINVTTKRGTNQFHGTAFEFLRNDKLDAPNFFSNRNALGKAPLRFNQFGGNLGGPIVRNRLFFFFNYEGARIKRGIQEVGTVATPLLLSKLSNPSLAKFLSSYPTDFQPTANPLVGLHTRNDANGDREDTTLSRVDADLGKHSLFFRLVWNKQEASEALIQRTMRWVYPMPVKNWEISDSFMISPTMFNEVRIGYNHYPVARHIQAVNPQDNVDLPGVGPVPKQGGVVSVPGLSALLASDSLLTDTPTKMFVDNFNWVHGRHTIKSGFEVRDLNSKRIQFGQGTWYFYNSIDDLTRDNIYALELPFGNPGRGFHYQNYAGYVQDNWRISRRLQLNLGVRYEYYTVFSGPFGLATRDPYGPRTKLGDPLWEPNRYNFAPRAGLALDLTGSGRTILRLGAGIFYNAPQPWFYYNMAWVAPNLGLAPDVNVTDLPASWKPISFPFPDARLEEVRTDPSKAPPGLAAGFLAPDRHHPDEYSEQYNISVQHAFTDTFAVQAAYVGNRALHMLAYRMPNPIDPVTGTRPHAEIGPIWFAENAGRLWYNGLQISANKRLSHGVSFAAYYSWAKAMQYYNADGASSRDTNTQDFNNIAGSTGPKVGEVRNIVTIVHSYELPTWRLTQSGIGRSVLGGWTLQGILTARSGLPLNILVGRDNVGNGLGDNQRPDVVPGVDPYAHTPNPLQWLNSAAFAVVPGKFGDLGYNTLRGPGALMWDLAIHKSFRVHEGQNLTFRCEMFNWMNHTVLNNPTTSLSNPTFGQILGSGPSRDIQLALKFTF